jgi:hypothetical protein
MRGQKQMSRIKSLLFLLGVAAQVPLASGANITHVVGNCKGFPGLPTISAALTTTPPPTVVEVCPGTYPEQIQITTPVTLEGITANNSTQAIITVPPGGLVVNTTDGFGDSLAVQIWVDNVNGKVDLTNLKVDGTGNGISGSNWAVGVLYQNSSGTMNHLTTQNQNLTTAATGVGVWLDGGSINPSVTLENSNIQAFDDTGVLATGSSTSEISATVKGNYITGNPAGSVYGIRFGQGVSASVTDNLITGFGASLWIGIFADFGSGEEGSISNNTLDSPSFGILAYADGVSVSSNRIYNASTSIDVASSVAPVTNNVISMYGGISSDAVGIDFECLAGNNVHSNTITGGFYGLYKVPTATVTTNIYNNVATIRSGGC